VQDLAQDLQVLKLIRRANLDAFWAREPSTVRGNLAACRQGADIAASLGLKAKLFRPLGPFPLNDTFGMAAAIVMLQASLRLGKYDKCIQFGTVRKLRSGFSNAYHVTAEGQEAVVMAKDTQKLVVTKFPTYGEFFEHFTRGMHKRMGEIVRPNRAPSLDLMLAISRIMEDEWSQALSMEMRWSLAMEGSFYLVGFCCALRGEEIPLTDLFGTRTHWDAGESHSTKHVVVALLGKFKGETGESYHLMPIMAVTNRGLEPRKWIGRLLQAYEEKGIEHGPMFRKSDGGCVRAGDLEPKLFERLEFIREVHPHLMVGIEDISEEYGVSRSFRRGATSEAVNVGVPPDVIDANNCW
jgi:hypothetical protein